ncbi:MAG TPA: hypothetical protein VHS31_01500 [Tepidisphaeraceae bacterium]|nr:hypothetical protein [Tepidisphaeraceae bacterium]
MKSRKHLTEFRVRFDFQCVSFNTKGVGFDAGGRPFDSACVRLDYQSVVYDSGTL